MQMQYQILNVCTTNNTNRYKSCALGKHSSQIKQPERA